MKKKIYVLFLVVIAFSSCKKSTPSDRQIDPQTPTSANSLPFNPVGNVGIVHNAALDYCYNMISSQPQNSMTLPALTNQVKAWIGSYLASDTMLNMPAADINQFLSTFPISKLIAYQRNPDSCIAATFNNYSGLKKTLITRIYNSIDSINTSGDLQDSVTAILQDATSLSSSDQQEIEVFANIATYSHTYWVGNGEVASWETAIANVAAKTTKLDQRAKDIIKGDIEWGVSGALAGAPAAGVGALAGAMIAAPLGSAFNALWSLF